ncbi:hypothetical protein [Flavobacterium aciduliphilum]|uniref:Lipoprotein n=1 Tax=Flavobacterium aciduliphilum TaxID=1101402 RepID=A0A328YFS4_9FLAO|nr:hypothetical protein [Flavobacterium aciduliphilum]RAR71535.1 hypothetical protein CLV55_10791 [Flavobacterium aciduliphilum]
MQKLTTRFLVTSLLLIVLVSCKSYQIEGANKVASAITNFQNLYFSNPETDYVYKAHIEVYGNDLSGVFVVKKINDSIHRVVLTTDFGNKLLDFEVSETDFKINYVVENLNKKIVINTLKKDFVLLLKANHKVDEVFENGTSIIFKSNEGNRTNFFYENSDDNQYVKLVHTIHAKEKVTFSFLPKNTTFAESIIIQHHNIKLKIELTQINN